jgi:uncharacterized protein (DUF849 family)
MDKLIITVALTGNVPTKEMNPNLPVTPEEIAADVRRCADAGAVVFHVHARDKDQKPTFDIDVFKESVHRIKEVAPEVIIQLSTGARAGKDWEARANPVRLLPEMASFTTGSNNLPGIVYENSPQFIEFLAGVFKETGVKPEIEVFERGAAALRLCLRSAGLNGGNYQKSSVFIGKYPCPLHLDGSRNRQSRNPPGNRRDYDGRTCARGTGRQSQPAGRIPGIQPQTCREGRCDCKRNRPRHCRPPRNP